MYQRLQGHLDDPWTNAASMNSLGGCYQSLGKFTQAIELFEQALAIAREIGDREARPSSWAVSASATTTSARSPGPSRSCRAGTGHRPGDRQPAGRGDRPRSASECCYGDLGQIARAIELYEQALAIARETGDRPGEAAALADLGERHGDLGQIARAIELYEQALAICRQIAYRNGESLILSRLGETHDDLGLRDQGADYCRQAIDIADDDRQRAGAKRSPPHPGTDRTARWEPGGRTPGHQRRPPSRLPP